MPKLITIEIEGTDEIIALLKQIEINTRSSGSTGTVPDYSEEMENMAGELDELTSAVEESTTVTDAVETLLNGIADKLGEAGVSAERVAELSSQLRSNSSRIAAAIDRIPHPDNTLPEQP